MLHTLGSTVHSLLLTMISEAQVKGDLPTSTSKDSVPKKTI